MEQALKQPINPRKKQEVNLLANHLLAPLSMMVPDSTRCVEMWRKECRHRKRLIYQVSGLLRKS